MLGNANAVRNIGRGAFGNANAVRNVGRGTFGNEILNYKFDFFAGKRTVGEVWPAAPTEPSLQIMHL